MIIFGHGLRILARCTGHRRGVGDRQLIVVIRLVRLAKQCHIVPHIVRPDGNLLTSDVSTGCLMLCQTTIHLLVVAKSSLFRVPWFTGVGFFKLSTNIIVHAL